MTLIWNIIQSVITILEIRVCVWMMEKFAEPRYSGKKQKIVVWIVTLGVGGLYSLHRWIAVYYSRTIILTLLIAICILTILMFTYYRKICIFCAANYFLMGGLIDLVIMSVAEIVTRKPGIFAYLEYTNSGYRIIVIVVSKAILFLIFGLFQNGINKKVICQLNEKKVSLACAVICVVEYVGMHVLTEVLNTGRQITNDFLIRLILWLIVILLILVIIAIIFLYCDKRDQLKQKNTFMESLNYENQKMIRLYREREIMYHDFKNHLLALDSFVQSGDFGQYQSYLENIKRPFIQKAGERKIGHDIMDLILNYKIGEAENQKIQVRSIILGYMNFEPEISDEDACSLLGNLWDNAIEACSKLPSDDAWIDFRMHIRPGKFLIEMSNPYYEILQNEHGIFSSTKKGKGIHGIGVKTIQEIAERYRGYSNYVLKDHVFKVEIMICNK